MDVPPGVLGMLQWIQSAQGPRRPVVERTDRFCELATYPVLLRLGYLPVIGGWLALKTAGSWGGWSISRTSFNRFLLNNILELAISYFWLARYVNSCGPVGHIGSRFFR